VAQATDGLREDDGMSGLGPNGPHLRPEELVGALHDRAETTTQNRRGEWVPAIPLPFYGLRKRCTCGRKFWTAGGYRGHYALHHAMGLA
jgi:hypothetical protein